MYLPGNTPSAPSEGRGVPLGEFLSEVWGWSLLAYGGDGSPKKAVANAMRRLAPRPFEAFSHWA